MEAGTPGPDPDVEPPLMRTGPAVPSTPSPTKQTRWAVTEWPDHDGRSILLFSNASQDPFPSCMRLHLSSDGDPPRIWALTSMASHFSWMQRSCPPTIDEHFVFLSPHEELTPHLGPEANPSQPDSLGISRPLSSTETTLRILREKKLLVQLDANVISTANIPGHTTNPDKACLVRGRLPSAPSPCYCLQRGHLCMPSSGSGMDLG